MSVIKTKSRKIILEDVELIWKNFKGVKSEFNPEGKKVFSVVLSDEQASEVRSAGIPVLVQPPKNEEYEPRNILKVKIKYRDNVSESLNPRVIMIKEVSQNQTLLNADSVGVLDHLRILTADVAISPYNYEFGKTKGVNAYLDHMYVVVEESPLDRKHEISYKAPFDDYDDED